MPLLNNVPFDLNVRPIDGYQLKRRTIEKTDELQQINPAHEELERLIIERRKSNDRRKRNIKVEFERRKGPRRRSLAVKETQNYNNIEQNKKSKLEIMYSNIGRNINIKV